MKKTIPLAALLLAAHILSAQSYICYRLIHTGVDNQIREHERQNWIRNAQLAVGAAEEVNRDRMSSFKKMYKKAKGRLNSIGLLMDAGTMGVRAYPLLNAIVRTQGEILSEVAGDPGLLPLAIRSQADFVDRARSIIGYMIGIAATYGDINMMKAGDRKMLLNHAVDELAALDAIAADMLLALRSAKNARKIQGAPFGGWVNREREIMDSIIENAKAL